MAVFKQEHTVCFQSKTNTFLFVLASRLDQNDENVYPKQRLESGDLHVNGKFENRASENAHVKSKNEYLNEYSMLHVHVCQPILM